MNCSTPLACAVLTWHRAAPPACQVRFGVLNAAFYGVGQSRKRAFLLAAAPGETMPDWPLPVTCFNSPQLTFNLPGGVDFCAVPQRKSAPLRAVTVRDVIGDLPVVPNGAAEDDLPYDGEAQSASQRDIRAGASRVRNHICKARAAAAWLLAASAARRLLRAAWQRRRADACCALVAFGRRRLFWL